MQEEIDGRKALKILMIAKNYIILQKHMNFTGLQRKKKKKRFLTNKF